MAKRVGIWIRVSTEDQKKGDSPEHHLERAKMYADLKKWEVVEEYHLEAISGKSVMNNPETIRMLRDIQRGHITGLIFSKIARFARNTRELLDFADIFQEYEADLISLQESIDTSSPSGRFFYTMLSAMAQWEREEIVDRIKSSVEVRAKMGKLLGGAIPYGYNRKGKDEIEINEEEAMVRKNMYKLFLKHKRYGTIAHIINEQGHRTKRGKKFSDMVIKRLLKDPIAKGLRRAHHTKVGKHGPVMRDPSEWVMIEAPAIVSEELWEEVNGIIRENEKKNTIPPNKKLKLFTRFLYCECGNKMYVPSSNPKYTCSAKGCKNKIHVDDIEAIFKEQLTQFLLSDEDVARYFDGSHAQINEKKKEIEVVNQKIEKLNTKISKLFELHEKGQIETERFNKFYNEPNEQLKQLKRKIPELEGEIFALKDQFKSSGYIIEEAKSLYKNWDTFDKEQKRSIIEIITEKIIVADQEITINLNYLMPPSHSLGLASNAQRNLYLLLETVFFLI